jgi:hypothetical protein
LAHTVRGVGNWQVIVVTAFTFLRPDLSLAAGLLPSQADVGIYTKEICRDSRVVSLVKRYAAEILRNATYAPGPDDVQLEAVFPAKNLVGCSILISTLAIAEPVRYVVGPEADSFKIVIGGEHSRLFPSASTLRPP